MSTCDMRQSTVDTSWCSKLLPNWRWDEVLGSGGFGAVFKVWEKEADKHFAVKLVPLSSRRRRDEKEVKEVQGEVKALAGLSDVEGVVNYCHSWFVDFDSDTEFNDFKQWLQQQCSAMEGMKRIHFSECLSSCSSDTSAAGSVKSLFVIKMEYFEGKNLKEWLGSLRDPQKRPDYNASETLPWLRSQILLLFYRIAKVLQKIHEKNFVHRDLKPQNILVDSRGNVAICDFGLSKLEETRSAAAGDCSSFELETAAGVSAAGDRNDCGTSDYHAPEVAGSVGCRLPETVSADGDSHPCGTSAYHAPEVKTGHSKQTDIYALGLIFLEMLTIYGGATDAEKSEIFDWHKSGRVHKEMEKFKEETGLIEHMLKEDPGARCSLRGVISCTIFSRSYPCNICGTSEMGLPSFEQHMNGRRHKLNLDKYRRGELKVPPPPKATSAAAQTPNRQPPSASRQQLDNENGRLVAEPRELRLENQELRKEIYQLTLKNQGLREKIDQLTSELEYLSTNSLLENGINR